MIWLMFIPAILLFTFRDLYFSGFPEGHSLDLHRTFLEWCFCIGVGTFLSCFISLVPFGIATFLGGLLERHGIRDREYDLIALRQQDGIKGQFFFLGAGLLGDRQYYFWYRRDGTAIRGGKTYRDPDVRIYESDKPKMVTFKTEYRNKLLGKWWWLIAIDMRSDEDWYPDFYIPKGSIKEGFSL